MRTAARRLLILGGTADARRLAARLVDTLPRDVEVISSYAGRTERPVDPPGTIREGGFGGPDGLAAYLGDAPIDMVIDATHPFAAKMSAHAAAACAQTGRPRVQLTRPAWALPDTAKVDDAATMAAAADLLTGRAARVFLSTGTQDIDAFAGLADIWFLVRLIAPAAGPLPLADYTVTTGRPPYSLAAERQLFDSHDIEILVSKHAGGPVPAKITAAVERDLPIILIRQPDPPPGERVETIDAAVDWVTARI